MKAVVRVEATIKAEIRRVWDIWTTPEHITNWNFATPEWHCPNAEHELLPGGKLKNHMSAEDGSMAFDYTGTFTKIVPNELLEYTLDDSRMMSIAFMSKNGATRLVE
jgi:uncharacterized protein YndB with AHSA1/START domain